MFKPTFFKSWEIKFNEISSVVQAETTMQCRFEFSIHVISSSVLSGTCYQLEKYWKFNWYFNVFSWIFQCISAGVKLLFSHPNNGRTTTKSDDCNNDTVRGSTDEFQRTRTKLERTRTNLKRPTAHVRRSSGFAAGLRQVQTFQNYFCWTRTNCNELQCPWRILPRIRIRCGLPKKSWQCDLGLSWAYNCEFCKLTIYPWFLEIDSTHVYLCVLEVETRVDLLLDDVVHEGTRDVHAGGLTETPGFELWQVHRIHLNGGKSTMTPWRNFTWDLLCHHEKWQRKQIRIINSQRHHV